MKYIKAVVGAVVALSLVVSVASASPSTNAVVAKVSDLGPWTFALSGQGNTKLEDNTAHYKSSTIGAEFELGHSAQIVLPAEVGFRQSIGYSDASDSHWDLSTKAFTDWRVFRLGNLEADAGGNAGVAYGNQSADWTVSPEATARLYLKKDVDLFGRVEYPYDITKGTVENNLTYTLGLRVRF